MEPPATWVDESRKPWSPAVRWSRMSAIYVQVSDASAQKACCWLVDPASSKQLGLGKRKIPIVTDIQIVLQGRFLFQLEHGKTYAVFGSQPPVLHDNEWHVQMPRQGHVTGICCVLGGAPGLRKLCNSHKGKRQPTPPVTQVVDQSAYVDGMVVTPDVALCPYAAPTQVSAEVVGFSDCRLSHRWQARSSNLQHSCEWGAGSARASAFSQAGSARASANGPPHIPQVECCIQANTCQRNTGSVTCKSKCNAPGAQVSGIEVEVTNKVESAHACAHSPCSAKKTQSAKRSPLMRGAGAGSARASVLSQAGSARASANGPPRIVPDDGHVQENLQTAVCKNSKVLGGRVRLADGAGSACACVHSPCGFTAQVVNHRKTLGADVPGVNVQLTDMAGSARASASHILSVDGSITTGVTGVVCDSTCKAPCADSSGVKVLLLDRTGSARASVHSPCCVKTQIPTVSMATASHDCFGFYDFVGVLHTLPPPKTRVTVREWLQPCFQVPMPWEHVWCTANGQHVPLSAGVSPDCPIVLRLRLRLRGGGGKSRGDRAKLVQHLIAKGVPSDKVEARADDVIKAIGVEALEQAYHSYDPWASLKKSVGDTMRLVLPAELRASKQTKPKPSRGEDPWSHSDPWSEAAASSSVLPNPKHVSIALIAGTFVGEGGAEVPILGSLASGARGVTLCPNDEIESFATLAGGSEDELAAVTIGPCKPRITDAAVTSITFPALSVGQKVLLKGWLVQFGTGKVSLNLVKHQLSISDNAVEVITVEIKKEYSQSQDWQAVQESPLRFVFSHIEDFGPYTIATWSKKWFCNGKPADAASAMSWHCFVKIAKDHMDKVIAQSGKHAIFLTPKCSESSAPSGQYKVIWLGSRDISKALLVQRAHQTAKGVVAGKSSLGLRVVASEYSQIRSKLEPSWKSEGVKTDIAISSRWVISPLPSSADKKTVQTLLDQLKWEAMPLKQIGHGAWLVGAGTTTSPAETFQLNEKLVLINPAAEKKADSAQDALVAGPSTLRRALNRHLAQGTIAATLPAANPQDAPTAVPAGPTVTMATQLRSEVDGKIEAMKAQFDQAIQGLQGRMTESEHKTTQAIQQVREDQVQCASRLEQVCEDQVQCAQRLTQIEQSVTTFAQNAVTKVDLTQALKEAMEAQRQELRQLFKRSPDSTPVSDGKSQRVQ